MSFKILTDTSSNLPLSRLASADVQLIPFSYYPKEEETRLMQCDDIEHFDGKRYYDEISEGRLYNTSQISPQTYFDFIAPYAAQGMDVLYIGMSSGISGSFHSSLIAKEMLQEAYPDRKFYMLDTKAASLGEGIVVLQAIALREQGVDIDTCYRRLTEMSRCVYQIFTVENLRHLQRTGRLSNASCIIGTVLQIKPILKGNEEGKIVTTEKVRGSRRALQHLAERYGELVKNPEEQIVGIAHANNPEGAEILAGLLRQKAEPKEILTVCYEPVTGAHVGPGTVALFFLGDSDVRAH